jgi:ATP phosphoribosyltransferase regulatory subunit HisZ
VQPGLELFEAPVVHADLAPVAALAAAYEHGAAAAVEVELGQVERFLNAQPGAPEHHDQPRARNP